MAPTGLPLEERRMILDLLAQIRERMFPPEVIRAYDEQEIFPEKEIRELLGPDIGLQLLFLPSEYGGLGAAPAIWLSCVRSWARYVWGSLPLSW